MNVPRDKEPWEPMHYIQTDAQALSTESHLCCQYISLDVATIVLQSYMTCLHYAYPILQLSSPRCLVLASSLFTNQYCNSCRQSSRKPKVVLQHITDECIRLNTLNRAVTCAPWPLRPVARDTVKAMACSVCSSPSWGETYRVRP